MNSNFANCYYCFVTIYSLKQHHFGGVINGVAFVPEIDFERLAHAAFVLLPPLTVFHHHQAAFLQAPLSLHSISTATTTTIQLPDTEFENI